MTTRDEREQLPEWTDFGAELPWNVAGGVVVTVICSVLVMALTAWLGGGR